MKHNQKQQLLHLLVAHLDNEINPDIVSLFQTTLFICLDYRNAAAHGGRIFNFHSAHADKLNITDNIIVHFPQLQNVNIRTGIHQFVNLLSIFKNAQPMQIITSTLNEQINRHLKIYPQDINLLAENFGIHINRRTYIFINEKTGIYHYNHTCGGLLNALIVPMSDKATAGYKPCKRCVT